MSPDAAIAALAARQHGVITHAELRALGLSDSAIARRLRAGRLHRIHRGVYAVGHPGLTADGFRLAAVLACGERALLSHHAAAVAWGVRPNARAFVDVTVVDHRRSARTAPLGVRLHRVARVPRDEVRRRGRLLLTSPSRTFVDCAAELDDREVELMLDEAWPRHLIDWAAIDRALRAPRPGVGRMRRVLSRHTPGTSRTRTKAEERLRRLVLGSALPRPEINVPLGPWEVDLLWREARLAVEVDSEGYHGSPWAQARDHRKNTWLAAHGYRVLRIPTPTLRTDPDGVVALIAQALRIGA